MHISVVIPTYRREQVLLNTVQMLGALSTPPEEIIIVDQTEQHRPEISQALGALDRAGVIRWVRMATPSIPRAMNRGLLIARGDAVLFLDDDIVPHEELAAVHRRAHEEPQVRVVAGRVLQPWDNDDAPQRDDGTFRFNSTMRQVVDDFMGGNFSINRQLALELGGFDENFVQVAHWFERDFADRLKARNIPILFEPDACIRHLKVERGGTREFGSHLKTMRPGHAVGCYYYLFRSPVIKHRCQALLQRPFRAVSTKYHLQNPWRIPPTLIAETLAFWWALFLALKGPRLLSQAASEDIRP